MPDASTGETKRCPACAEEIKAAAVICKHCGYDFALGKIPAVPTSAPTKPRSSVVDGVRIGCGMFIILPILIFVIVAFFIGILSGVFSGS